LEYDHMTKNESLGSLFGKAKKWAQQELANATKLGGDPQSNRNAEEQNDQLARQIESDAKLMRDAAIVDAVTPQGLKDYQATQAANRAARDADSAEEHRAERLARSGESSVELSGYVTGSAAALAVEPYASEETGSLHVTVEAVDPVPMQGGTFVGFLFTIPGYDGDGTYSLVDDDIDGSQYELFLAEENEGWGFHPTHGPGTIVVTDGIADVQLTIGSSGSDLIQLRGRILL
jgi:hypothetical protein